MEYANWDNLGLDLENNVCLIGAGFSVGVLENELHSTGTLISLAQGHPGLFPILCKLLQINEGRLPLNTVWKDQVYANSLVPYYDEILNSYDHCDRMYNLAQYYNDNKIKMKCTSKTALWILLGVELKKLIAMHLGDGEKLEFKKSAVEHLGHLVKGRVNWISMNYDLVLEHLLVSCLNADFFSIYTDKVRYAFEPLLTGKERAAPYNHLIIKPHGSLNVFFKTKYENLKSPLHSVGFVDPAEFFSTVKHTDHGYTGSVYPFEETRACMIGYVPDAFKDELNSNAAFSDYAHDFCKWNMAQATFELRNATSVTIIGYSMPEEDKWVWKRFEAMTDKSRRINIASGKEASVSIAHQLEGLGFSNVYVINNGYV